MENIVEISNLSYSYGGDKKQLDNINLSIKQGEVIVITGPSGSGKSTLSKVINGLIPYFYGGELQGTVRLLGKDINELQAWERSMLIGNVFQDPRSQFFSNEVAGEIAFGCENLGIGHAEIIDRVNKVSMEFGLDDYLYDKVRILSYGMRQKVAIASAKAIDPVIYVMDEPSANLDLNATLKFAELISGLKASGKTIIIAEHRLYYLKGIADRIIYIKEGAICEKFSQQELMEVDKEKYKTYGLRIMELEKIGPKQTDELRKNEVVFKLENINKKFGGNKVLNDVNFTCSRGEVIAIVGLNSCGKSTLGKILAGLVKEDSGKILYNNKRIKAKHRLGKIWYVSQDLDTQLFGESVLDEVLTGNKVTDERIVRAEEILEDLDLIGFKEQHPTNLSGGQKQRLALAVALMNKAEVIVLDEPTSGLDAQNMRKVGKQINKLAAKGHIILMITHDIECAMETCQRVIQLKGGTIYEDKTIVAARELINMCIGK